MLGVLPGHAADDNSEAPLEVRPHWRIIGNYPLIYGGTRGHATAVLRAAANASVNASLIRCRIIKEAQKDGLCLTGAFSYK